MRNEPDFVERILHSRVIGHMEKQRANDLCDKKAVRFIIMIIYLLNNARPKNRNQKRHLKHE